MSYDLVIEEKPSYLHARVRGTHNEGNARRFLVDVYEARVQRKCSAVLLEMNLCGPSLGVLGVFHLVAERAPYATGLQRIAYVDGGCGHDQELARFAETVARNRGVNVRLFGTVGDAERWLREQTVPEEKSCLSGA
jgi:hypothetical protein